LNFLVHDDGMMGEHCTLTGRHTNGYILVASIAIVAAGLAISLAGCGGSVRVLEQSSRRPYDWESHAMHPRAVWHQFHNDSLRFFLELPLAEMLYTREASSDPFRYSARLDLAIEPRLADGRRAGAPHYYNWDLGDTAISAKPLDWLHFDVPLLGELGEHANFWTATWVLADENRDVETGGEDWIEGGVSHAVLPFEPETGRPLFDATIEMGAHVAMLVPNTTAQLQTASELEETGNFDRWRLDGLAPATKLPAPPFVRRQLSALTFADSSEAGVVLAAEYADDSLLIAGANYGGWPVVRWTAAAGPQRVRHAGTNLQAVFVGRAGHFPEVRDVDELIASARYIATRPEFKLLENAPHPKLALDKFWLACDPDSDDARALIRTYYRRVREANTYFSGLRDGWRTDRGLVHIIFGPPGRVRRGGSYETWIYGDETNINAIIFQFRHRYRGDEFNVFELDRSVSYRASWDARVKNWRNGRINTD
jgi:GWxTD domain-containing protein